MDKLLRRIFLSLSEHLSDDRLASLFCGELPLLERWAARQHLATCWQCKLRKENLEGPRADRLYDHYLKNRRRETLADAPEIEFSRKLRLQIQNATPQGSTILRVPKLSLPGLSPMNPAFVVCMVFGFATALSFYFWWQQRAPRISSNALLVRAERWDTPSLGANSGVVYQAVRITMTKDAKREAIARSIYRDTQGKRQPKRVKLKGTEEQLKSELTEAGLDWDEPLSASSYQSWHDRQHVREDHIARAGAHLLRLTTTVPDGLVEEQSLTVRDTDFHPVRRTVSLRDSGTVEIAEVDFKILPWSAVTADIFEPVDPERSTTALPSLAHVLPFPRLPEVLTEEQLDGSELAVRLVLNQLHADTGEQIELHRSPQGISIDGLVETDARKQELQAGLRTVPHVVSSIRSVDDLKSDAAGTDTTSIRMASMPDQPSPLETYLHTHGQSISGINVITHQFYNNALTISQESKAIHDLETRFATKEQTTVIASATLEELIYSHRERLKAAMTQERALLAETQTLPAVRDVNSAPGATSLTDAAERNLALSKELTQINSPSPRSAEEILAEIWVALQDLTASAQEAHEKPQGTSPLSGKK